MKSFCLVAEQDMESHRFQLRLSLLGAVGALAVALLLCSMCCQYGPASLYCGTAYLAPLPMLLVGEC
jgi:hypothetical protein